MSTLLLTNWVDDNRVDIFHHFCALAQNANLKQDLHLLI